MNKLRKALLRKGLLLGLFLLVFPARADIVYPARLQLTETAPGVFEVVFTLPVINGRILKAQPVFPDFCNRVSEPTVQVDAFQKKSRWEIRCEIASLHGVQVGIEGLLGSPIDILLEVNTLEGRTYQTTLSPNESYYQIPPPPGLSDYLRLGTLNGARNILWQWGMALMFLAWLLTGAATRFKPMLLVGILGASLGNFLLVQEWLLMPSWVGPLAALVISLVLLLPRALGLEKQISARNGLVLIGIGSLLIGGGLPPDTTPSGYTAGELAMRNLFGILGTGLGVILFGLLMRQVLVVIDLGGKDLKGTLSRILASLSLGVGIWKASLFWDYPSMLPSIPWILLVFALSMALWMAFLTEGEKPMVPAWLLPAAVLGYFLGTWGMGIPFGWGLLLTVPVVFLITMLFRASLSGPVHKALLTLGGLAAGNYLFSYADASLSYPLARSVFFFILLLLTGLLLEVISGWLAPKKVVQKYHSAMAAVLLAAALFSGVLLLVETYDGTVSFPLSEGRLPIPFLSVGLFLGALMLWPRKRKIHLQMGVDRKAPVASLALLMAAIFFLPVCGQVRNPWYRPDQMDEAALQGLVERRLWNTYTAFNIADEDALFDQLADNLDEGLLDNIYLDSRRRLTMGLREGSEVTVENVDLGALGTPETTSDTEKGWRYPATWTVTARVKHLKHIHYRKNQYTGTIALKPMENGWKISEIILTSEDRQVIAAGSL